MEKKLFSPQNHMPRLNDTLTAKVEQKEINITENKAMNLCFDDFQLLQLGEESDLV